VYQDLGQREELTRLFASCLVERIDYLLVRRLDELGDSVGEVRQALAKLSS
jgi:DNA invertase Pin-like site-specific DNA recombinase